MQNQKSILNAASCYNLNMTNWSTVLYGLLPHPNQPLVLVESTPENITLPTVVYNDWVGPWNTYVLKPVLEKKVGIAVNILRYVARDRDEESKRMYSIHLLEPRSSQLPSDAHWQPLEKVLRSMEAHLALRDGLIQWQSEKMSGLIPERRAPWALPGWHARAEKWIADRVADLGRGTIYAIQPVKSWSISCVLKVFTESGNLYFKAPRDLPLFVNEGVLLENLANLYPDRVPKPVAVQPEERWMLLDDFGDISENELPLEEDVRLMQDFASLQIDSSRKIESLLAAGCKDRRLNVLLSQIEPLLNDGLVLSKLDPEDRAKLQQAAPRLRELIVQLFSLDIPCAILHGDLHGGNVIRHGNTFLYFDWTDAAISHPFFDMIHIFHQEDVERKTALQESYLALWEEHYSKAHVRRAWQLASVLYGFYHAVSYQTIVHGIEELVQPELDFAFYFLRKLLSGLPQLDST
jgi:hypothetical protein